MAASVEAGWPEPNPKRQRRNGSWDEDDSRLMLQMMLGNLQNRHSQSYGDAKLLRKASICAETESAVRETETLDLLGRACCSSSTSSSDEKIDHHKSYSKNFNEDHEKIDNDKNTAVASEISAADLDFDALPVPAVGWEKCLDLQTGKLYYIDRARNDQMKQSQAIKLNDALNDVANHSDKFSLLLQTPPPPRSAPAKKQTSTSPASVPDLNSPATPDLNDPAVPDDNDNDSTSTTSSDPNDAGSNPANRISISLVSNNNDNRKNNNNTIDNICFQELLNGASAFDKMLHHYNPLHNKSSSSASSGSTMTIFGGKRKASSVADFAGHGELGSSSSSSETEMVTVVCSKCLMLVLLPTAEPRCPNCRSAISL